MAQQVEIFNIEFGDTLESINKLKAELKETRKLFETAKPNTAEFVKYSTEVKRLDGTIKALNGAAKDNQNALGGINTAAKFASGSYGELKQKIEQQKKALLELNTESEEFVQTQEELIKLQNQRIEIEKKIPSLFQERIKGAIDESNALKQLKIDLKAAQSAALNGDGKAAQRVAELKDKIDDLKDSTQVLQGSGVERLNTSMAKLTQGFMDFDTDKIKTGFKGIGAAMSAIPIVLIIEGIKALIENFDKVVAFAKELTGYVDENAKAVENLTNEIKLQEAANIGLTSSIENEIAMMTAQGASIDDILKKKKELVDLQVAENDKNISLSKAKIKQIQEESNYYETAKQGVLSFLGFHVAAINSAVKAEEDKALKVAEVNNDIAKAESETSKLKTSLIVEEINAANKLAEERKKRAEEKKKLDKEQYDDSIKVRDELIKELEDKEKAALDYQVKITKDAYDVMLSIIDDFKDAEDQKLQDDITRAETKIMIAERTGGEILAAELELLKAREVQEVQAAEENEVKIAEIRERYRNQETQLKFKSAQQDLQVAQGLANSLVDLSDAYYTVQRNNLEKGSEEDKAAAEDQFNTRKALSIVTTLINGAVAVVNAFATLPFYANVAAAAAVGTTTGASVAKIASQKFQYFDGGFTNKGNPYGKAQSMGNAQFHNDEYVVPSKVKNLPQAKPHISMLETMRKGYTPSGISGFYDGGFTARSSSNSTEQSSKANDMMQTFIKSIPAPVVRVSDINKVNSSVEVGINVSKL